MKATLSIIVALLAFQMALAAPLSETKPESLNNESKFMTGNAGIIPFSLKQRGARSVYSKAVITFAANDEAWLFLNHIEKGHLNDPKAVKVVVLEVKRGDVIALKVKSGGAHKGVAVNVEYNGLNYPSNGYRFGSWKAKKSTGPYTSWMLPLYSSCTWWRPASVQHDIVKAEDFPYSETGASYMWANSFGRGDMNNIWMRHVIGEENCKSQTGFNPRKRVELCDLSTPACQAIWGLIPGLNGGDSSTTSDPDVECRCRRIDGQPSLCYRMEREGSRFNKCHSELCGDKYECVKDGAETLPKCLKRAAESEVVLYPMFSNEYRKYCRLQRLSTPKIFYVVEK